MKAFFSKILAELQAGRPAVLLRVIASTGSAPRGAGARMALFANGDTLGTIGGGAVEYQALLQAKALFEDGGTRTLYYALRPEGAGDLGMICGGGVTVSIQYISPFEAESRALFAHIREFCDAGRDAWLVSALQDEVVLAMGTYDREEGLRFIDCIQEEALLPLLGKQAILTQGEPAYYVEPICFSGSVYVFGGGHVGVELVPLLAYIDFRTVLFEDREAFATPARFPAASEVLLGDFERLYDTISLGPADYAVIMTRGHQADYAVLAQVLRSPVHYIGLIGSRHKRATTYERLRQEGFGDADIARIHSPIGLAIGAQTPAEIAVSIAAELIAVRAHKFTSA